MHHFLGRYFSTEHAERLILHHECEVVWRQKILREARPREYAGSEDGSNLA